MKWKCANGTVMDISDMTDTHLANAIAYSERNKDYRSLEALQDERERRNMKAFMATTQECPWCKGQMRMGCIYAREDEWFDKYRLICESCGATSNERKP